MMLFQNKITLSRQNLPRSNTGIILSKSNSKKSILIKEFTINMCTLQGNLLLLREMVRSFFLTKIADKVPDVPL